MNIDYTPLSSYAEWAKAEEKAYKRYVKEVLPPKPTMRSVRKRMTELKSINLLQAVMLYLLFPLLAVFVGLKASVSALPYVDGIILKLADGVTVGQWVFDFMSAVAIAFYFLVASVGLVYSKVMHELNADSRKATALKLSWSYPFRSLGRMLRAIPDLEYWTPRFWYVTVWAIIFWLGTISFYNFEGSNTYLWLIPLVLEVAMSFPVASLLTMFRKNHESVKASYVPQVEAYEEKIRTYRTDKSYLRILYEVLRETLRNKQDKRGVYPNRVLFDDPNRMEDINAVVQHEFKRWNMGQDFAEEAKDIQVSDEVIIETLVAQSVEDFPSNKQGFIPLNGASEWTETTLLRHLQQRGIKRDNGEFYNKGGSRYTEYALNKDYANGYNAREAFRELKKV